MPDVLAWRKKFGVLAPSTNTIVEPDLHMMDVVLQAAIRQLLQRIRVAGDAHQHRGQAHKAVEDSD